MAKHLHPIDPKLLNMEPSEDNIWINGEPMIATKEECEAQWDGVYNGETFRCCLCGYKFYPGCYWRYISANRNDVDAGNYGNFLVCEACDGPDVLRKRKDWIEIFETRYWRFAERF